MFFKIKKLLKYVIGLLLLAGVFYFLFDQGYIRFNYPEDDYPITGIDISHHQGDIDWDELKSEDLYFVFIKATEGGDFKDKRYSINSKNALENNMLVGAYHYFSFCKSAQEQFDNYVSTVGDLDQMLPPVIDLEYDGHCNSGIPKEKLLAELKPFIELLKAHYNRSPIIYLNKSFYEKYIEGELEEVHLWIRDIYFEPELNHNKRWDFWQYSNRGRLNGIEGPVDLNVFYGSLEELKSL